MPESPEQQPRLTPRLDALEQPVPAPEPDQPGPFAKSIVGIVVAAVVLVVLYAVNRSDPGATSAANRPSQAQTTGAGSPGPANK
jgi:hypothetical protein